MMKTPHSEILAWFEEHINCSHDWCLIWPFGRGRGGYGSFQHDHKFIYAHRHMCELVHGAPPDGHQAAHSCGRGHDGCVNPRHLSWKTPSENQRDRTDPMMGRRRLTAENVIEIRRVAGLEHVNITAERFGVTEAAIRQVQSGKTWRDGSKRRIFTDDEIRAIRRDTRRTALVAPDYGVSRATIDRIRDRGSYAYVPDHVPLRA